MVKGGFRVSSDAQYFNRLGLGSASGIVVEAAPPSSEKVEVQSR